jgi:hypothetical protein
MTMSTQQRVEALNVLTRIVTDDPTAKNLTIAQNLLQVLQENSEDFWQAFWDVMSIDPEFRAEADLYMAAHGVDVETRQSVFAA